MERTLWRMYRTAGMTVSMVVVALLLSACSGAMTLTEYADEVEELVVALNAEVEALDAARAAQGPGVEGEIAYWESRLSARKRFLAGLESLHPPSALSDLHDHAVDIMRRYTVAEEAVAIEAAEIEDLPGIAALWAGPEVAAWRVVDEESQVICRAAQRAVDETEARAELEGLPWIPGEMKETVQVAFGCGD